MNDTTEEQQQQQEPQSQQDFPGRRLGEAREAAGMSRSEVASQLRLNERMIVALEEDNYELFPSATFVSGHLRSYARVLGLPEEDYVRPVADNIEPPSLVSTIGSKEQASSSSLPVRLVTYLLVIAVIVSVAMWWLAQHDNGNGNGEPAAVQEETVDADGNLSLTLPSSNDSSDRGTEAEPVAAEEEATTDEGDGEPEPVVEASAEQTPQAVQEPVTEAPQAETEEEPVESAAADETEAPTPPPLTANTPKSKLELRYQADSWTEVNDSAGRSLVYGLIKAGQVLELKGEAPFRIFLGYAPGVTVYYNGDLFDHSPFQRRDVARFRIGRAEHNLPGPR